METLRKTLAYCLFPLTVWYAVGVAVRNLLFDWGLLRSEPTPMRTIGLGNLSAGGTGKTPHAEWLLRQLPEAAFLSRGYRRKSKGYHTSHEGGDLCALLGDEPAMVAQHFPDRLVAVCEDRSEGLRRMKAPVVVMDDCLQHRQVRPDCMILLTEYAHPYYKDRILPFGNLREGRRGARRADCIVVTKCPEDITQEERTSIQRRLKTELPVFFSTFDYALPASLPTHIHLLTGIAHPEPLVEKLSRTAELTLHRFPDHHDFTQTELDALPAGPIYTTEKDAARLRRLDCSRHSIIPIPIKVRFLGEAPTV